ncbi:rhamnulokinase, partial [Paenibacillus sepulcri]|nr:rhamnulokinase [Paenibacillus sepulcri]
LQQLRITEIHRFVNEPVEVGPHLHWDILMLLKELKTGILKARQQGFEPASFGIDTWGVDFGLLDRNGELLANPYHYRDPHTTGLIEEVCGLIGEDKLFRKSGLQLMPFNTIYQLYAMKKAGSVALEHAETLLLTPDLLNYFLTGQKACEFTMATTTQLFRPAERAWNTPLMERLGIPSDLFLDPVHP